MSRPVLSLDPRSDDNVAQVRREVNKLYRCLELDIDGIFKVRWSGVGRLRNRWAKQKHLLIFVDILTFLPNACLISVYASFEEEEVRGAGNQRGGWSGALGA